MWDTAPSPYALFEALCMNKRVPQQNLPMNSLNDIYSACTQNTVKECQGETNFAEATQNATSTIGTATGI